jgi:DNA-directed RNA polymerase subunit RPC12/RpoP
LGISTVLLLPGYWYFWLLTVIIALALLVEWHAKYFVYRCPRCGKVFGISALEDLLSPNGVNKKYLRCPICRRRAWAEILRIKEQPVLGNKLLFEEQNNTGHEKGKG